MSIVKEVEKVIAELAPGKAIGLKILLNQFETVRQRNKQFRAYNMTVKTVANFEKTNCSASWN